MKVRTMDGERQVEFSSVDKPRHYVTDDGEEIGPMIRKMFPDYYKSAAMKYLFRAGKKNADDPVEDLCKARRMIELEIEAVLGGKNED